MTSCRRKGFAGWPRLPGGSDSRTVREYKTGKGSAYSVRMLIQTPENRRFGGVICTLYAEPCSFPLMEALLYSPLEESCQQMPASSQCSVSVSVPSQASSSPVKHAVLFRRERPFTRRAYRAGMVWG